MNPEVPPTENRRRGIPMALALEQEYTRGLINLAVRERLAQLKRKRKRPKKRCRICDRVLKNQTRTFCSKGCICAHMTQLAMSPEYYAQRAEQRQKQLVTIFCKICGKDMGRRKPGGINFCSRECVGRDPAIRAQKAAKRAKLWQDQSYRQAMSDRARVQVADPNSRFGPARPSR